MALDEFDPSETRDPYYPDADSTRANARLWSIEKTALELHKLGIVSVFTGAGSDPTGLSGYSTAKLWLQVSAGVTDAPGTLRVYAGTGDAALIASWPTLLSEGVAGLRRHLSTYSKAEVDALVAAGVPAGFGTDDVLNDSSVSGASATAALNALKTLVDAKVATSLLGANSGVATLDSGGKLTTSQIPAILTSPFQFQGTWNASTNTPTLVSSVGTTGHLYRVSVAGTTSLDGEASWAVGDELYFGGGVWNKLGASAGSTTINLPSASADTRITLLGITNGNSNKYLIAGTADGRVLVWGDTANLAFNPVGDRYTAYEVPVPWASTVSLEAIYCGINYALFQTDEATDNLYHIGSAAHGQAGNGGTTANTAITKVGGLTGIKVSRVYTEANRGNTEAFWFALTSLGRIYSCGYSGATHTQGYNSTTNLTTPRLMTLSDGSTAITDVVSMAVDTAYAPVWAWTSTGKALRWGAGTDGAHGNNSTTAMSWPDYLETSHGSGIDRTDIAQVVVAGSSVSAAKAASWIRTSAGKIEASGSRVYGNGDGAALGGAAVNTFQAASGAVAALTVSALFAGGGEYYNCLAITSTGQGYLCGYLASYGLLGNGSTTNLNTFTILSGLPSGFAGALTGARISGGNAYTTIFLEATISTVKTLASIGYDVYYNTAKATASVAAASQTWGLVKGARGSILSWQSFGTHQEHGLAVLNTDGELRTAGPSDQGQSGVSAGQVTAIDILQPVRTGLPRLVKNWTNRGAYSALTEYSYNDTVTSDGSTWLYIYASASTGSALPTLPTTSNTYWRLVAGGSPNAATAVVAVDFDGAGAAITANTNTVRSIPFACTITKAELLADATGSMVVDVQVDTYSNYPPSGADSICAAAKPTLSSANKASDSTLTGWTTAVAANSVMRFNVDSCSGITAATLSLTVLKT